MTILCQLHDYHSRQCPLTLHRQAGLYRRTVRLRGIISLRRIGEHCGGHSRDRQGLCGAAAGA